MEPVLLLRDGTQIPLTAFDVTWCRADGWRFTATATEPIVAKVAALGLFGTVQPVVIEKSHRARDKTSLAGRMSASDPPRG